MLASLKQHLTASVLFTLHGIQMKLLIRNLSRSTTQDELRSLFEAHGAVQSCTLVMDKDTGKSKGFGFIEMPNPGESKTAMKSLNGKDISGSKIRVKKAEQKEQEEKKDER